MQNKIFILILIILALPIGAQAQTAGNSTVISNIKIEGNFFITDQEIMNVVFSRVGDSLFDKKINSDVKAIYALGYFKDVSATFEASPGGTEVIFKVVENPKIRDVVFEGNTVYTTAELRALIASKKDQILNFKTLQEDISTVNSHYKDNGYILARVIDVETDEIYDILRFKIIEGVVESITLNGNDSTKDYVILRELKTKPGSIFNEETFRNDLRRIFNLGFFSEVTPNFEPGSAADKVIVVLNIKESRTSTINFGGGYGEREGWFGFVDLSINNLMGTGQGLLVRGQSGQQLSTYQFKYTNPWLWPEQLGDHAAFTFRRWLTVGRDIYLTDQSAKYNGFDVSLAKPILENYRISWTLGSELAEPYDSSTFESYQSDTIGTTLSYDTRDFWLNPTTGRYYSMSIKQGWKKSGGTTGFFKLGWDFNHYNPMFGNQVFANHLGAGIGFGDIPVGEEYWAGGANSVRGYYPSEARRGTRKLIFNAEWRLNFSEMFQGVFFYDWGNAWNEGGPKFHDFIWGWGPGVRINTPLGPIRLDYGVPGGQAFGAGIMHFSIGQAF